jgi:hypothetical protein
VVDCLDETDIKEHARRAKNREDPPLHERDGDSRQRGKIHPAPAVNEVQNPQKQEQGAPATSLDRNDSHDGSDTVFGPPPSARQPTVCYPNAQGLNWDGQGEMSAWLR